MTYNVRGHSRRTQSGGTTNVRQHARKGGLGTSPGHAWKMASKGVSHAQKGRKGLAAGFITFGVLEVILWAAFQMTGVVCGVIGALLLGIAWVLVRRREGWQ